jgi:hypothetical protein
MGASLLMSKIISFNDAKQKKVHQASSEMKTRSEEQRRHKRVLSNDRLFVQIVVCEEHPSLVGSTISCSAMDITADGLGIRSYEYIPEGSQLDLWLDIGSRPGKLFLTSDVRWVTKKNDSRNSFELGVVLQDAPATDIEEWRNLLL